MVCEAMPGMEVRQWDFKLDGDAPSVRRKSAHDRLVQFLDGKTGGPDLNEVAYLLSTTKEQLKGIRKALSNAASALAQSVLAKGYRFVSVGRTRGASFYLEPV